MGNHPHIIFTPYDTEECIRFYQELMKKITDSLKCLLGEEHLNLWETRPTLMVIPDLEAMIGKIAYLYSNPAAANLVNDIDEYPGLSSWKGFKRASNTIEEELSSRHPWINLKAIPTLKSRSLRRSEDATIAYTMREACKDNMETLTVRPNSWMKRFGISRPEEVENINRRIRSAIETSQREAQDIRRKHNLSVFGPEALRREIIMKPHTPKPRGRMVYICTTIKELRIEFIKQRKAFCKLCRECYLMYKAGNPFPPWPPGAVRPSVRPVANPI